MTNDEPRHDSWSKTFRQVLTPDAFLEELASFPPFSSGLPAHRLETRLGWDDLVLRADTRDRIEELLNWVLHHQQVQDEFGFGDMLRTGFCALFYGPPGTGKKFAATLLGKSTDREVYRVDLSAIVSKYIGETESSLSAVFDMAQDKNWILYFDEADALFGERTEIKDAQDRYANVELSFLLQRIEACDGLCILASNLRSNIDVAFLRRFNAAICFPPPGPKGRIGIWQRALPVRDGTVDLVNRVKDYEITGASIVEAVRFAQGEARSRGRDKIELNDLELGVKREIEKVNKAPS